MVSMPTVSVITPNYNGGSFIQRVVESVQQQHFSLEHIVVDDCSTDNSWAILQELGCAYPWLKAVRLDKNSGPVVARNKAIEMASGRFLALLDVDDFWLPNKLKTQVRFMQDNDCGLSFSDYRFVSEDGRKIGRRLEGFHKVGWHLHHMTRYLGCLTMVVDRNHFPDFKFPNVASYYKAEDFIAWSRCMSVSGRPALRCPHDLARYSVVNNSRSSDYKSAALSVWKLYRDIEKIGLLLSSVYFFSYSVNAAWKRLRCKPILDRSTIDEDYSWSLLD
ncbi:MAG: glycosyltransferase family 2 protein [Limnobacter sp.]|uniref:glycosyltransferase family 2 protein n=1 Tax=Limnobacter sp. TaxID=2003368 RepID=UPI0032ED0FC9